MSPETDSSTPAVVSPAADRLPAAQDYAAIYFAPHLDDVALSCGGQVFQATQRGERVLIVTVMAGDAPPLPADSQTSSSIAQELHQRWALGEQAAAGRRAEDRAACAILRADFMHMDVPDCIYRHHEGQLLYQSSSEIFGHVDPHEDALAENLAERFRGLPAARRVIVPVCVGHHVDHLLVRRAAETVWGPGNLHYYEDYPYVEQPGTLDAILQELPPPSGYMWKSHTISLSAVALAAKCRSIAAFQSQLSSFFVDMAELEARVFGFAARRGGERLWFPAPDTA